VGSVGAVLVSFVNDLVDLFVAVGLPEVTADPLQRVLSGGLMILVALGIVRFSEPHTTPLNDPRNDEGEPLVAASDLGVDAVELDGPTVVVPSGGGDLPPAVPPPPPGPNG
jgi:hypothetical protein